MNLREKIRIAVDAYSSGVAELDEVADAIMRFIRESLPKERFCNHPLDSCDCLGFNQALKDVQEALGLMEKTS